MLLQMRLQLRLVRNEVLAVSDYLFGLDDFLSIV